MNFAVLISQFPRSILSDERTTLVLATLERIGLATDEQLSEATGLPATLVSQQLVRLIQNRLVEYEGNHIKVTNFGRQLLERLSLDSDILEDVLDSLKLSGKNRAGFKKVLELYRTSAFDAYLYSLCRLTQWKRIFNLHERDRKWPFTVDFHASACARALVTSDLKLWHSQGEKDDLRLPSADNIRTWLDLSYCRDDISRELEDIYYIYFSIATLNHDRMDYVLRDNREVKLGKVFDAFCRSEGSQEPKFWLDAWDKDFTAPKTSKRLGERKYLQAIEHAVAACVVDIEGKKYRSRSQLWPQNWVRKPPEGTIDATFLPSLLISKDINELSTRTRISNHSLEVILNTISSACARISNRPPEADAGKK